MNILSMIISRPAKKAKLLNINFNKAWWDIFAQQKSSLIIILLFLLVDDSLNTLLPLAMGWVIGSGSINSLVVLISAFLLLEVISWFTYIPLVIRFSTQTYDSFRYNAFKTLLAIDPIYHMQRPSGAIVGKINRTNNAFLEFVTTVIYDLIPFVIEILTLIGSMFYFDIKLGLIVAFFVLFITVTFCITVMKYTQKLEQVANKQDDIANQKNMESLSQLQFIRSVFATDYVKLNLKHINLKVMITQTTLGVSYRIIRGLFVFLYFLSLG